jgi:NADH:ubiquinone oxidoreductase subunit D
MKMEASFRSQFRANSPATHGIFQNILLMDGERILEAEPTIGYILLEKLRKTVLTK